MEDFTKLIRAYALRNALDFGKVDAGRILPKLFAHGLEKSNIGTILPLITQIVHEVNALSISAREKAFGPLASLLPEHEEKEKTLPPLPDARQGTVVTRLPPEPSKHLHVGHGLSFLLNADYARSYGGKVVLRLEDCNPEKCTQAYADSIIRDITEYLQIHLASISYVSDDMPQLLDYAVRLIQKGEGYMCFCSQEQMRDFRHAGKECACRTASVEKTLIHWRDFVEGLYGPGNAVLRHKGDMSHDNHVMRDSVLWREVDAIHFRHKKRYKIWPMYDFYNAIEDSVMGVTHVLRSNEFHQRGALQQAIRLALDLRQPTVVEYGRFSVAEKTTKGREIRELVESGAYIGWDDPRLVTLQALRRRGISKEVLIALMHQVGLKKAEVIFEFPMIAAVSRKLIDATTERFTFVPDPIEITVSGAPTGLTEIAFPLHPNKPETRTERITPGVVYLSQSDWELYKGKEIRLLHGYNLRLHATKKEGTYTSTENKAIPKVTWVSTFALPARVLMDDGTWVEGKVLEDVASLKLGTVVQFERFGFCKLDKVVKKGTGHVYEFWFTHP
ncbi:glutamate--tRNA ligase [Candidatus Pacearchaeota archaeon]|nr:glutamate--tRNA ligase [Candidatus Pacearchaeota archaeon]